MRTVLIDESGQPKATPFDTEAEAIAALRKRIAELIADPEYYLDKSHVSDIDKSYTSISDVLDEEITEMLCDVWVQHEGSEGVWSNFSSADRWSVSGMLPEDEEFGNGDTRHYRTAGCPSGQPVRCLFCCR